MELALSLTAIILSAIAITLSLLTLAQIIGIQKSTHQVSYIDPLQAKMPSDDELEMQLKKVPELSFDEQPPTVTGFETGNDYQEFSEKPYEQKRRKFPSFD
jgi:hypothetical protein